MTSVRKSFSLKVVLLILLIALPVFFASMGILFRQSRKMIRSESVERANVALMNTVQRINRYIVTTQIATDTYAWLAEQYMQPDSLQLFSQRVVWLNPYIDGCSIGIQPDVFKQYPERFLTYSLREADSVRVGNDTDSDYSSENWYATVRKYQRPHWEIYSDKDNNLQLQQLGGMLASYCRPLFDDNKRFVGVISSGLSLRHLSKILASEKPYPHSFFIMVDEDGRFVAHPDSALLYNKTIFSEAAPQKSPDIIALGYEMTKGKRDRMSVVVNGSPSLVCYCPVPGTPWSLAIVCPDSDILYGYNLFSFILIPLLIVGLLVIVVNCHRAVTVSIAPLNRLVRRTQAVASGKTDVEIEPSERKDVIGNLQNSFATMFKSLNYYVGSVKAASEENRRYNDELIKATEMVKESERQKTAFTQNVTHQIRTPLNIIMGFAQVLSERGKDGVVADDISDEELVTIAGTMKHNALNLNHMIFMLYDSSESGQAVSDIFNNREQVECGAILNELKDYTAKFLSDKKVEFISNVPDDFSLKTNYKYLAYSIQELINNAGRYSDGLHISVSADIVGDMLRFTVQDTGKGIAEADLDRIFRFFTKVDDFSEGLGLGLPLTMRHAKNLGGDFRLDTSYREGCRFIFEVPFKRPVN